MDNNSFYEYEGVTYCCASIEEAIQLHNWEPDPEVEEQIRIEEEKIAYIELRKSVYPPIEDFADAWVKQDDKALEEYRQKCLAVKEQFPKPE